jgi:hypothetical protein
MSMTAASSLAEFWADKLDWPTPVKREDIRGPVPDYTPEELTELLALLHPLRIFRDGRWLQIPVDLPTLRASEHEYRTYLDEQQQANFKASAAYVLATTAVERQRQEEAADRREQQEREVNLAAARDRKVGELIAHGVSPREAEQLVDQHRPARA